MSKGYVNLFVKDIEVPKKVSRKAEETLEEIIHTAGMEKRINGFLTWKRERF